MRGVVFLHAFPYNPRMWEEEMGYFRGRLPVLAPHYLGLSLSQAADRVLGEMDEAGLEEAVFVGLSMGGYLIFELWRRAPERFLGLVLADTRAGADTEEGRKNRYALRERVLAEGVGFLPEALLPNHLGKTTQEEKPEVVARAKALILEASPEAVAGSLLALAERPDSTPLLPGMRRPALVLVGEEDTLTPPEEAKRMAKALPDARLLILPEAGHLANLENPKAFRTALLGFLAEVL
ncbi:MULTISPECIES: alpha/beta fold hydrolase [Thermus]|uniref:3-oxoadipate enol-lactonase n=1 Tax=Thermus scotoductus (strain ATCC 700910 / SA-01) TaxID=743525 RepID=E8PKW2_THESS|nr:MULTISPECIES: alpha/beta fold hydrolase [Thermus]ADW21006.1 3-oxoadipate enol-lactonase [Thermus scotoductus SA-01]